MEYVSSSGNPGLQEGGASECRPLSLASPPSSREGLFSNTEIKFSRRRFPSNNGNTVLVVSHGPDPDHALVTACRAGNRQAFTLLVLRHKDRLYTLAYRLLGDLDEAEDIAQETFLKAYEKLDEFRGEAKFSTWLYRICHNFCLNHLEKKKDRLGNGASPEDMPVGETELSEQLIAKEYQKLVQWALSQLKLEFREVVVLYHQEHLSYEEIANLLDLPIGTIRSRLHRGRKELKDLLRPYLSAT
jgi:RNA polymerase sigma-70 factor (ECF subfamily)